MSQILKITKKEELIKPLISDPLDEEKWIQNEQILRELEAEEARLKAAYGIAGFLTVAPIVTPIASIVSIPAVAAAGITAEYLTRVNRLYRVTKMLLDKFGQEGITITMRVQTTAGLIDLFVKMADKRPFALLLRSNGESRVRWREDLQDFRVHRPGKSPTKWRTLSRDAVRLKSTIEIKESGSLLMGKSRSERTKRITKAIVLCGKTKIHEANHDPECWVDYGATKALRIYQESSFYIIEESNLIDFLLPPNKKQTNVSN